MKAIETAADYRTFLQSKRLVARKNLERMEREKSQATLFDFEEAI